MSRSWRRACVLSLALCSLACNRSEGSRADPRASTSQPAAPALQERATPATSAPASSKAAPSVVFLGDSISAGYGLAEDQAYPALLEQQLAKAGHPIRLVNAGLSGDTSAGGLRRVDWVLSQHPDLVVLELGGNDGLRGSSLSDMEANLRAILKKVHEQGACSLLLGMQLPPSMGTEYARDFAAVYPRIAHDLEVPYVPFFMQGVAGKPELNLEDGIHPTAEGQRILAAAVQPTLERALEGCAHGRSGS